MIRMEGNTNLHCIHKEGINTSDRQIYLQGVFLYNNSHHEHEQTANKANYKGNYEKHFDTQWCLKEFGTNRSAELSSILVIEKEETIRTR